jgi:L-lactate dehydrogenase complex protein LldG
MEPPWGTSKEEFLASVRQCLGGSSISEAPPPPGQRRQETIPDLEAQAQEARQRIADRQELLTSQFLKTAGMRGWNVRRAANSEDALGYIGSLAASLGIHSVVRSDQPVFLDLPLDPVLQGLGFHVSIIARDDEHPRELLREATIAASLGITGADYAVAETGSVVVLPRQGLSRLVSLVPPVHLAIVRPQEIVGTLDDVFLLRRLEYYRNNRDMGSYLNFITGPSRTADIEQTLVVGVHGPREVHLVFLD